MNISEAFVPRLKEEYAWAGKNASRVERMDDSKRYHGNRVSKPSDAVDNEIDFINEEREALGILQEEITKAWQGQYSVLRTYHRWLSLLRTVGYQAFPPYFGIKTTLHQHRL
jgi:ribosome-binding protein aMBF1 (putative translation factor)